MAFADYPGFTIKSDLSRVRRPDGGKKRKPRLRARRRPVYLPTSNEFKAEQALWLRRH